MAFVMQAKMLLTGGKKQGDQSTEQMTLKKGLSVFGEDGRDAVRKEMKQLHDRDTIEPCVAASLSREQRKKALQYLMFLKRKRCGRIKGRGCADGRKQRIYKDKSETSSPTVKLESLMLSGVIDAHERRKVATLDVPGAFMQTDIDEEVHVRLEGEMAELLASVDSRLYEQYMVEERGKSVLYVKLKKALYGTLQAALLFWKDLSGFLVDELGYTLNKYDSCVANKMVNGKQCTILWHVDDLKISHVEESVIEEVIAMLNERYGKLDEVTVTRGDVHEYLGMTMDYSVPGEVSFKMTEYVEKMLDECPEYLGGRGTARTPATTKLFEVNESTDQLDENKADEFHHVVAQLLFLSKRARPDLQTAVAFLTTMVTVPDEDDMKKLGRVMKYLRETKDLFLTLSADNLHALNWWVDASFAVHKDMRSHTGVMLSLGRGAVYANSTRQKLNTRSSTEAELVGVDDAMPMVLWVKKFMEEQGFKITENIVYQDNQSAILLERNGKRSSTKRTRHLDVRYYFVTDRIGAKELCVKYCPTEEMRSDGNTKPLMGAAFLRWRRWLLNCRADGTAN